MTDLPDRENDWGREQTRTGTVTRFGGRPVSLTGPACTINVTMRFNRGAENTPLSNFCLRIRLADRFTHRANLNWSLPSWLPLGNRSHLLLQSIPSCAHQSRACVHDR